MALGPGTSARGVTTCDQVRFESVSHSFSSKGGEGKDAAVRPLQRALKRAMRAQCGCIAPFDVAPPTKSGSMQLYRTRRAGERKAK